MVVFLSIKQFVFMKQYYMDNSVTKYSIKFLTLTVIILLIFKYVIKKPWFDSTLLAMIVVVALISIENILETNQTTGNPTDCSQCKINEGFEVTTPTTPTAPTTPTTPTAPPTTPTTPTAPPTTPTTPTAPPTTPTTPTAPTTDVATTDTQKLIKNKITTGTGLDNEYTAYDKSNLAKYNDEQNKQMNLYKMSIGNQPLIKQYLQDGNNYYNKIYGESTNGTKASELMNNELEYSDYNYISELNAGMINPMYTYVMPSNWAPIRLFPPVCAVSDKNRSNVTAIINNDGTQNLMNYASLKDFDKTSRVTGNIGINTAYIEKFLNNSATCN